jgi:hypothetical protein
MTLAITSVVILRDQLLQALTPHLGNYERPSPLPPVPAIWVLDRPVPKGYKIIQAKIDEPPINALEVIIHANPGIELRRPRNFGATSRALETWQIWLVFHESRQNAAPACKAIADNFITLSGFDFLPRSDLNPDQYSVKIQRNDTSAT